MLVPLLFGFVDFQPTFCNIGLINSLDILKCNKLQDTLLFEEGTNITIDLNNVTKSVKISSTGGVDVKSGFETVTEDSCTSVSFNTSFSSTPVAVGNVINGAENNVITINALTTSGFDLCMSKIGGGASSSYTVYWIATNAGNP